MKNNLTLESIDKILESSGFFFILLGILVSLLPNTILDSLGAASLQNSVFFQFFGVMSLALGVGYYITSHEPIGFWPVVLVGFVANVFSAIIFTKSLLASSLVAPLAIALLAISLVWSILSFFVLNSIYNLSIKEESAPKEFADLIKVVRTSNNQTLLETSEKKNVLLVFIRHFGCTFCRETVSEIASLDKVIAGKNLELVYVHMSDRDYADEFFKKYYDHPVAHISDPSRLLYRSLNLKRGSLGQLFGPMTWIRGIYAGIFKGHGIGPLEGDGLQLGGVFVLSKGQIIFEQKAKSASQVFELSSLPEL